MKAEVIKISALFLGEDSYAISQFGEVLLFECSLPDQDAVVIPYGDLYGQIRRVIALKKKDINICFHDAKTNLISFKLSKPVNIGEFPNCENYQTVTLKLDSNPEPYSLSKKLKSEFTIFLDFSKYFFHDVEFRQLKNTDVFLDSSYALSPSDISPSQRSLYEVECKSFLRSYVCFLNEYQLDEREFKKFMRSQENLPKFLKDVLMIDDPGVVLILFHSFLRNHICSNEKCAKVTHKKCSSCRSVSYCSMKCHTQRWPKHEESCKDEVNERKMYEVPRKTIFDPLMKRFSEVKILVSIDVFQQELMTALFETLTPIIEETSKLDALTELSFKHKAGMSKSTWLYEIKSLKKKEYSKLRKLLCAEKVISQWSAAWEKNFDVFLNEWYQSEEALMIFSHFKRYDPCQIS